MGPRCQCGHLPAHMCAGSSCEGPAPEQERHDENVVALTRGFGGAGATDMPDDDGPSPDIAFASQDEALARNRLIEAQLLIGRASVRFTEVVQQRDALLRAVEAERAARQAAEAEARQLAIPVGQTAIPICDLEAAIGELHTARDHLNPQSPGGEAASRAIRRLQAALPPF